MEDLGEGILMLKLESIVGLDVPAGEWTGDCLGDLLSSSDSTSSEMREQRASAWVHISTKHSVSQYNLIAVFDTHS